MRWFLVLLLLASTACDPVSRHLVWIEVDTINGYPHELVALPDGTIVLGVFNPGREIGGLIGISPETGEKLWESFYEASPLQPFTTGRDTAWIPVGDTVYGYDPAGTALGTVTLPCAPPEPLAVRADGDAIAVDCGFDGIALITGAGDVVWTAGGRKPAAIWDDALLAFDATFTAAIARDLVDGTPLWEVRGDAPFAGAASTGALVAIQEGDGGLLLLDADTGAEKWRREGVVAPPVFSPDGTIAVWVEDPDTVADVHFVTEQGDLVVALNHRCNGGTFDARGRLLAMCAVEREGSMWQGLTLFDPDGEIVDFESMVPYDPNDPLVYGAPLILSGGRVAVGTRFLNELSLFDVPGAEPAVGTWSRHGLGNGHGTLTAEH